MRRWLIVLITVSILSCKRGNVVAVEDPFAPIPHAAEITRRYKAEEIGVPLYPGAEAEYYENDFMILGKALEARTALRTTDSMRAVVSFYKEVFRQKYGDPTYEYEGPTYYMAEKRRDSSTTFPFFVVAVADMGSYRRITIHRLLNYDNVNGDGNVRTSIRFR